jgi:hypothetical protein
VAQASAASQKKRSRSRLVTAVVYIVIVLMILSIPAYITLNTVVNVTTIDVTLSVDNAWEVADPFHAPADGNRFVRVSANVTNNGKTMITLVPFEFHVLTHDGTACDYSKLYEDTVPETLDAGEKAAVCMCFEVPLGKAPAKLSYQTLFTSSFAEAVIGTIYPTQVMMGMTVANVTDVSSPGQPEARLFEIGFNMTNGYDEAIALDLDMFRLMTTGGKVLDIDAVRGEALSELPAKTTGSYSIVYEVPAGEDPETLTFECGGVTVEDAAGP